MLHRVGHRARHGVTYRETSAQPGSYSSTAARILRGVAHCLGGLELRVLTHVTEHAHLGALVHRGFDFLRQGNIFDDELGELEAKRLEFILQLLTREFTELVVV